MGVVDLDRAPSAPLAMISPSARRARDADLPALARLVNRAYAVEAAFVDGDRTDTGELAELSARGHFLVLDRAGGELAAAVYVAVDGPHASVGLLAVAPELQRFGLGRRLVALAEALAAALGCHDVGLSILDQRSELLPWYRSQGYREVGTAPFAERPTRRPCHRLLLAKTLPGAAN
jgi:ribosomal protein S18 acetylase RimI-like enzyme